MLVYAIVMMVLRTSNMRSPDHISMDSNITVQILACPKHFALLQTTSRAGTDEDVNGRADERKPTRARNKQARATLSACTFQTINAKSIFRCQD